MKARWKLNPEDVLRVGGGGAMSMGKNKTRARYNQLRYEEVVLFHKPTGVSISGNTGRHRKSKTEWKKTYDDLCSKLMKELEEKVARHLKIPGR